MRQGNYLLAGLVFILCLLLPQNQRLHAQSAGGNGALRGSVLDADFSVPLQGVTVVLEGIGVGAVSDEEGSFFINDVPPGSYAVLASKGGFIRSRNSGVVVSAGAVKQLELELTAEVVELDEFIVQEDIVEEEKKLDTVELAATLNSFASAINPELLKRAGSSGDIGSSLKRLASTAVVDSRYVVVRGLSDRYNVVVLNGARIPSSDPDKRAVNVDIFPNALVGSVISAKTFVPSMPGEVTGGYINILTKRVPSEPFVSLSTSTGFDSNTTGKEFLTYLGGGTGFLGTGHERRIPDFLKTLPPAGLPAQPTSFIDPPPDAGNEAARIFSLNRSLAAQALAGTTMGVSTAVAPIDFSVSLFAGTRIEDFMGGTLGIIGGVTYSKKYRTEDSQRGFSRVSPGGGVSPTQYFEQTKGTDGLLAGVLIGASLEFSPSEQITFNYFANIAAEDEAIFAIGESEGLQTIGNGVPLANETALLFRESLFYTERRLQTWQLSGQHLLSDSSDAKLDWVVAYSTSSQDQPDQRNSTYAFDYSLNTYVSSGSPSPPDFERVWRRLDDSLYNIAFNVEIPLDGQEGKTMFRFGGSMDYHARDYVTENFDYQVSLGVVPGIGPPSPNDSLGFTLPDLLPNLDLTDQLRLPNRNPPGSFRVFDNVFLSRGRDIPAQEKYLSNQVVPAAHGGFNFSLAESMELSFGARLELTKIGFKLETEANSFTSQFSEDELKRPSINRVDLLPAFSAKWTMNEKMAMRTSVTRTIARPTFKEIAAVFSRDPSSGNFFVGNPRIQLSSITNYDVRWEWNPNPSDQYSVSLFAKQISKPIEQVNLGFFNSVANDESANLFGFELEGYKKLGDFMPALEGFSLGINYSYVYSQVDLNSENELIRAQAGLPTQRPLQGQPDYTFNANLTYDNEEFGWSTSVFLNVTGPLLYTVGGRFNADDVPDISQLPYTSLDLSFAKKLSKTWELSMRISNLLNEQRQRVFPDGSPFAITRGGIGLSLGLSGKW